MKKQAQIKINRIKAAILAVVTALVLSLLPAGAEADISERMVREAWRDVSRIAEMDELPLEIKEDKVPNAWVTAGKSVTVTTGLMNLLQREEEMFGVLSHEAGHAKLKHYEKRVNNAAGIGLLAAILGSALDSSIGEVAVGVGANLAAAGFSREQEVAADDFAVDIAFKGGKDPTGIYTALERLASYGGASQPSGFSSHPPDERRLRHVKERILASAPNTAFPQVEKVEKQGESGQR